VEINTAKVRVGDLAEVELVRSKLASLQFQNLVRQQDANLRIARNRLQTLLGRAVLRPDFDVLGDFRQDGLPLDSESIRQQAFQLRPDLQALARDEARSLADIRLQIAQGKVDYSVGAQYHRQYGNAAGNALGFFFSAPLPVFNRNQGEIERSRQEQRQIETRMQALKTSISTEVENVFLRFITARDLLKGMRQTCSSNLGMFVKRWSTPIGGERLV